MKEIILVLSFFVYAFLGHRLEKILVSQYYSLKRFYKTLPSFYIKEKRNKMIYLITFFFFLAIERWVPLLAFIYLFFFSFLFPSFKQKWTKRSIRLFLVYVLCYLPFFFLPSYYITIFFSFFMVFVPLFLTISYLFIFPFEKAVSLYYVKKAQKKLKKMPHLKTIAVTGSYGKSSCKNFLLQILSFFYPTQATPKSYNTVMGITKFINQELLDTTEILILEFGVDEKGGMDRLCHAFPPDYGILLSIGKMHLATFHTLENIFQEKRKILDYAKKGFFSLDNAFLASKKEELQAFSSLSYQDYFSSFSRTQDGLTATMLGREIHFSFSGAFQLYNIAAALMVGEKLGLTREQMLPLLPSLEGVEHRLEKRREGHLLIYDDAYNGNEEGILEAILTVKTQEGKKAILTPGVIELGKYYREVNENIGKHLTEFDLVLVVSEDQNHPIYEGYLSSNGNKERFHYVSSFKEGMELIRHAQIDVLLIANDAFSTHLK